MHILMRHDSLTLCWIVYKASLQTANCKKLGKTYLLLYVERFLRNRLLHYNALNHNKTLQTLIRVT